VKVSWSRGKVCGVEFVPVPRKDDSGLRKMLEAVLRGGRIPDALHVDVSGLGEFTRRVLGACAGIRSGEVLTYAELARKAGCPRAARAAGQVMARNPHALLIPCHRVVGSDLRLRGFGGGLGMKEFLLRAEGWSFAGSGSGRRVVRRADG
jgi:methylated-DNA-[protein]-cysteine S-methyltransferase